MTRILIFANGELPNLEYARNLIQAEDFIICADGGIRHTLALGFTPQIIIGDLDSLPENFQPAAETQVLQFPADKNETDLELAIDYAFAQHPSEIVIVGAMGGRLDQTIGNISLITDAKFLPRYIRLHDGVEEIFFCRDQASVKGGSGDIVSLIPWDGVVTGIVTENLKWPLQNETLYPNKTRGISNEMLGKEASIKIKSGLLLIVHRIKNL